MKKPKLKFLDDMGLCISGGAMVYGYEHGAMRWAPEWVKHSICNVWNWAHCTIAGHDSFGYDAYTKHVIPGPPVCTYCCAHLKINGRYPTLEEIKAHNELCEKGWEEAEAQWRLEHPDEAAEQDRQMEEFDKHFPEEK